MKGNTKVLRILIAVIVVFFPVFLGATYILGGFDYSDAYRTSSTVELTPTPEPVHGWQKAPVLNSKSVSYYVSGNTRDELCDEMLDWQEKNHMGNWVGYIDFNLSPTYYIIYTGKGYTVGEYTVNVNTTTTVPQWSSSGGASSGTKDDWQNFKNSLVAHENQHQDIVMKHGQRLVDAYNNLGYFDSEAEAVGVADTLFYKIEDEMIAEQGRFDENYGEIKSFNHLCR